MDIENYIKKIGLEARKASYIIASAENNQKNIFLSNLSNKLLDNKNKIIAANNKDLTEAVKQGLDDAFIDRLKLTPKNITAMADGLLQIKSLANPVGNIINKKTMASGIIVSQMRVPLGVIGMIYESRPNVTIDAAGLAIKSGNSIILRGGSESIHSNSYLNELIKETLIEVKLHPGCVQIIETTDRDAVTKLIKMNEYVDVIIPRGGKSLIKKISADSTIHVIKHLDGNCHIYIDDDADLEMAVNVVDNSKTQRLGTCNTLESLVVSSKISKLFLPNIKKVFDNKFIEIRGCKETQKIISGVKLATENDYYEEYLGPTISCIIVESINEAITHINKYSSRHTESITTNNETHSQKFIREVDSSSVMVNTSTRFADGFEYGLGAEIGISTDKFHARGPVGLEGLTSLKYVVLGTGQIRE